MGASSEPAPFDAEEIRVRLRQAIADTEKGALETGDCIGSILDVSVQLSDDAKRAVESVSGRSGLFAHLDAERSLVSGFSEQASSILEELGQITRAVHEASSGIREVANVSSSIAESSRLLTINAQIEAARANSKTFAVIASEMQEFTKCTREANEQVTALASQLLRSTPQLVDLLARFTVAADAFSSSLTEQHKEFLSIQENMGEATDASLKGTHDRAREILTLAQKALACLQFQDPVRQSLDRVQRLVDDGAPGSPAEVAPSTKLPVDACFDESSIGDYHNVAKHPERARVRSEAREETLADIDVGSMLVFGLDE